MKQLLNNLSPKAAAMAGALGGILTLCTIGFFILLGITLSGSGMDERPEAAATAPQAGTATQPTPQPVAGSAIQLKPITEDDWYKGDKDAPITIVEFSDTECPFCKRFHPTMEQIVSTYDDVKWVYKHAPLDSLHRKARKEAEALECAGELGGNDGFWAYTDRLFALTPSNDGLDLAELPNIAESVGLDRGAFETCLSSGRHADAVQEDLDEALAAGLRGTPYSVLIVDGKTIPISGAQPFEQVQSIIESVR